MKFAQFPPTKASDLEPYFTGKTLGKAREIASDDMVKLLEKSATHISARVQGSEPKPYLVVVRVGGDYDCSCPSEVQPCKHVAAALLYAIKPGNDETVDLTMYLQNLDTAQAKALLLELAEHSEVRQILLNRQVKTARVSKGAIKALKRILERGTNIEDESELGEAAFVELEHLEAHERSVQALELYDIFKKYEPDYSEYDPEDESGEVYWEDLISEWMDLAMTVWGNAEFELNRGEEAFEVLLKRLGRDLSFWDATLEVTKRLNTAGNTKAKEQLATWLEQHDKQEVIQIERFTREFLQELLSPEEYENYLRDNLETARDHAELFKHLQAQNRSDDALEVAANATRNLLRPRGYDSWGHFGELEELVNALRAARPSFEWERAAFILRPSLTQYRALKNLPEFLDARAEILGLDMPVNLRFDVLLEDDDRTALEALIKKHPSPSHALKVSHLFPEISREIFKKAALEGVKGGERQHYKEGTRWAEEYRKLEEANAFKTWLSSVVTAKENVRRPALQDEFKKLKAYLV